MSDFDTANLRRASMEFLARREHSVHELRQKLLKKFSDATESVVNVALDQLEKDNLQSDTRFAESYSRYRKNQGFGCLHIRRELALRGVKRDIVERYVSLDDDAWVEAAAIILSKPRNLDAAINTGSKEHLKLLRHLRSRGFLGFQIKAAMRKIPITDRLE